MRMGTVRLTHRDEGGIVQVTQESLHNDSVKSILLHPLEMQIDNSLAGIVIQLHRLPIGCRQGGSEEAVCRILADIGHKLEFDY
jgi:hypothetical protein